MSRSGDGASDEHMILETTEADGLGDPLPSPTFSTDRLTEGRNSPTPIPSQGHTGQDEQPSKPSFDSDALASWTTAGPHSGVMVIVPAARYEHLPYSTSKSGLVYDSRMRFHVDQTESNDDAHPERPGRILEVFDEFVAAGLVPDPERPSSTVSEFQLVRIPTREAEDWELCMIHSPEHIAFVRSSEDAPLEEIRERTRVGEGESSIYWHNLTWLCAKLSAGGAIEAARAVVTGQVRNAVAVIRPPGHHAEHDKPSGFCFFNNVPIAARAIQREFPEQCRKILILDWDVHHGNGTQHAFYDDPNILYISIHVFMGGNFYPFSYDAGHTYCGSGPGQGRNVNIPWMEQGMTDADYMLAFQRVVMPICVEFDPDLVMISAGFDAAAGDPLGGCYVTPACYSHMTHMLMQLARGKVVACLEGGYNLRSTATSMLAMTRTLMGEAPERMGELTPTFSAVTVVQEVINTLSAYWKCLYPKIANVRSTAGSSTERLHDVIRERQSKVLWDNYGMVSLFIRRAGISKSFKDQVLATQNFQEERPLLLIFHDPPQATDVSSRATSNVLELHNTLLTDSLGHYIEWAVKQKFAVIDVNIPKYITKQNDDMSPVSSQIMRLESEDERSKMCRELAHYIWDNYIELALSTQVFFMGVGEAMLGLIDLLRTRDRCLQDVSTTFGFVAEQAILAVTQPDDESVARTYYAHSMVFVADKHPAFQQTKKPKRRHGSLKRSPANTLQDMLDEHREEVFDRLLLETEDWRGSQQETTSNEPDSTTTEDDQMDLDGGALAESASRLPVMSIFPTSSPAGPTGVTIKS